MNKTILTVTNKIIKRSRKSREIYLARVEHSKKQEIKRLHLSCSNLAHAVASMSESEKNSLVQSYKPNMAIVTAYNDMLSAHQPYGSYPAILKLSLVKHNATAQVAGGVPAMCDGVTQSQVGMELSLFSRDNIAQGTAIALSHNVYDGAFYLGVCDKIVPGLLIGALSFGHLPTIFVPSGPMPSGISNLQKAKVREKYANDEVGKDELLNAEMSSYHSCGTCTFFGTANSNQMLLEMMGLQLPNSSFVNTNTPLREALTKESAKTLVNLVNKNICLSDIINEKSFVNAIVGLMATGGSTNHTIHLIAMARASGIVLTWDDFDEISKVVPLLCKMYPNGSADVNHFRDAGGMSVIINQLLEKKLVHNDVQTVVGFGLDKYIVQPYLKDEKLHFVDGEKNSKDLNVISNIKEPFSFEGGLKVLDGNIGRSVIKTSSLKDKDFYLEAEAIVFESQEELQKAFKEHKLEKDFIAVIKYQGPKANGMPELHSLTPVLGVLQEKGFKVALITDGRMSGASGKVPSAIHMVPEAVNGGIISKIKTGDIVQFDVKNKKTNLLVTDDILNKRVLSFINLSKNKYGSGRELFSNARAKVSSAEEGASIFELSGNEKD